MKKILSVALAVITILTVFAIVPISAKEYSDKEIPELFISKIGNAQTVIPELAAVIPNHISGNPFEFMELVNLSGKTLNLYDYCITYQGNSAGHANFEAQMQEKTPIQAGDWRDGSTYEIPADMKNPATATIAPGEVVVLWSIWHETLNQQLTEADFRKFWKIPDSVKVYYWDGGSNVGNGGHDKNFNMKNSATGTYGIARLADVTDIPTEPSTPGPVEPGWPKYISWTSVAYDTWGITSTNNETFEFILDKSGTSLRRALWAGLKDLKPVEYANSSVGVLTAAQIESFGDALKSTETPATTEPAVTDAPTSPKPPVTTTPPTSDGIMTITVVMIMLAAVTTVVLAKKKADSK